MQLQRPDRQNLITQKESDEESFQCKETLYEPASKISENRIKPCGCRCRCNFEEHVQDAHLKKRQKRKESKRRLKQRQKEAKEKAFVALEEIIRDIYNLRISYRVAQAQLEECLATQTNRERLCQFINTIIRDEVQVIRKAIATVLRQYEGKEPENIAQAINAVFKPICQIAAASNEVEKLINFFLSEEEDPALEKNFGKTTLRFLYKTDLAKSETFKRIYTPLLENEAQEFEKERQLLKTMLEEPLFSVSHSSNQDSATEEDAESYLDSEQYNWEQELSTIESPKQGTKGQGTKRKRKAHKRKIRQEFDSTYEAILKRTIEMEVDEYQRAPCNVTEECRSRLSKKKWLYSKQHSRIK